MPRLIQTATARRIPFVRVKESDTDIHPDFGRSSRSALYGSNGQGDGKSTSPAPSNSTVSTRSRTFARSDSGKLDSPEKGDAHLPSTATSSRVIRSTSRSEPEQPAVPAPTGVEPGQAHGHPEPWESLKATDRNSRHSPLSPAPLSLISDQGDMVVLDNAPSRAKKDQSLTPDPSEIDFPSLNGPDRTSIMIRKRKAPLDDESDATPFRNGESSSEATPRTSPILGDDVPVAAGQAENAKDGGPKRAPRKKRKWLKKGEVDPDDPVAVAKQKERHMLIDEADKLLAQQIEQMRGGCHPSLRSLWRELDRRFDLFEDRNELRKQEAVQELERMRDHAIQQAHAEFKEQSDQLLHTLRDELRHFKHKIVAQSALAKRPRQTHPLRRQVHGTRSWPVYDSHLLSEGTQDIAPCKVEGEMRERRDHRVVGMRLSSEDAHDELARIREAVRDMAARAPSPDKAAAPSSASGSRSKSQKKSKSYSFNTRPKELPPSRFERWDFPAATPEPPRLSATPSLSGSIPPWSSGPASRPEESKTSPAFTPSTNRPLPPAGPSKAQETLPRSSSSSSNPPSLPGLPQMAGQRVGLGSFGSSASATPPQASSLLRPSSTYGHLPPMPQRPSQVALAMANNQHPSSLPSNSTSAKSNGERVGLGSGYRVMQTARFA